MDEKLHLVIQADNAGEWVKISSWSCPVCGDIVERRLLRGPDEGPFPDDHDYTLHESNLNFLFRIIDHLLYHIHKLEETRT